MKKTALSLLLAAAALFSACGAAPDTAPLATPTPDPAAAAEPTPEPQNEEFYALDRGSSTFNSGDAYYEFTQKLGYCLLLKTDYATAAQTVCCEIPGCTHDAEDCPAYFPGLVAYYIPFTAEGQLYVLDAPTAYSDTENMTWEDYYAQHVVPNREIANEKFEGMTEQEIEKYYYGIWQQQVTALRLYAVNPAEGNTYLDFPRVGSEAWFCYCDGESIYGVYIFEEQGQDAEYYRVSLADGSMEKIQAEPTEEQWIDVYDGAMLTMRYVTDAPLPEDWEQYRAAIQNATVEFDRYDPRTGERRKLAERPYDDSYNNGYCGTHNGKLYFTEWVTNPQDGIEQNRLIQCDPTDGSTVTVWDTTPDNTMSPSYYDWVNILPPCDHSTERWIWLSGNSGWSQDVFALLDTETFAITPITQKIKNSAEGIGVYRRAQTSDGRWLIVTETADNGSPSAYGLIAPEALVAGSTDWTPVTMWQG